MSALPVSIVTGFLGSGKTTLLSNLLGGMASSRLAILVNEFGEVSIDGALLRATDSPHAEIHDLSQGLVAYSDDQQFVPTMQAIAARRHSVDHVLIETSGLALPTAVMETLQRLELAADFMLDATLAVVDTPLLLAGELDRGSGAGAPVASLFEQQLEFADIVVLNKIDGLGEPALLEAEERVRAIAPRVRFLELAFDAKLDPRLALGLRLHEARPGRSHGSGVLRYMPAADASPPVAQSRFDGHVHGGFAPHAHGLATHKHFHEHDPGWQSFVLRSAEAQPAEALREALTAAARAEPILRIKGFAAVAGDERRIVLQGVRSRIETRWASEAAARGPRCELVFIGYHPNRAHVVELLRARTRTRWD